MQHENVLFQLLIEGRQIEDRFLPPAVSEMPTTESALTLPAAVDQDSKLRRTGRQSRGQDENHQYV